MQVVARGGAAWQVAFSEEPPQSDTGRAGVFQKIIPRGWRRGAAGYCDSRGLSGRGQPKGASQASWPLGFQGLLRPPLSILGPLVVTKFFVLPVEDIRNVAKIGHHENPF